MAWTKHFKIVNPDGAMSPISGGTPQFGFRNYQNPLPDVYTGHPNRIERYNQYENMDLDPEVNAALDTIAEFCTQENDENNTPFAIQFSDDPTKTEADIINEQLKNWVNLNKFERRMMKMIRNMLKYGDQIFIRDPETFELFWVDMAKVSKIVVNESQGKRPEQYFMLDISPNFENLTGTTTTAQDTYVRSPQTGGATGSYTLPTQPYTGGSRFTRGVNEKSIAAEHIVHLSLTEGLDANWPFGISILENVFKVYKQKELLEDAILIYRVQRAPERRIFYIDVGNMPSHLAMQFVERVKNEIHQKRLPTQTGGGSNIMDATYNPLSINEDYFFPQTAEGRGSKVETLPGGQNLGEIDDLRFFNNKLMRGLRVPSSYLPTGPEDGTMNYTDGKVTTALIQEHRFNQYCKRLQDAANETLDKEFKIFLNWRGFNIDNSLFKIKLTDPLNFAAYRSAEMDSARISAFTQVSGTPYLSKRFMMKKYLGLSESEIKENEGLWREEMGKAAAPTAAGSDLRNVGVTPGSISGDLEGLAAAAPGEPTEPGLPGAPPAEGGMPQATAPGASPSPASAPGLPGTMSTV